MRTFASCALTITKDLDQRQKLIDQLLTFDDTDELTASTFQSMDFTLIVNEVDRVVPFVGVSAANTIFIIAYQAINVKLNAGITPGTQQAFSVIPVPAVVTGNIKSQFQRQAQPGMLLLRGRVTSIHLTNLSNALPASCYVALVGEA